MNAWILDKWSVHYSLASGLQSSVCEVCEDVRAVWPLPVASQTSGLLGAPAAVRLPTRSSWTKTVYHLQRLSGLTFTDSTHIILFLYFEWNVNTSFCVARNLCPSVRVPVGVCSPECRLHWAKPQVWCGSLQFSSLLGASNGLQSDIQFPWLLRPRIEVTGVSSRNVIQIIIMITTIITTQSMP